VTLGRGWPDLNRRPVRPEAKSEYGLPALRHDWPENSRPSASAGVHWCLWWLLLTAGRSWCASSGSDADTPSQQDLGHYGDLHRGSRSGRPWGASAAGRAVWQL